MFQSALKCKLSRSSLGSPIQIVRRCNKCGEHRCRSHCKCGRSKTAIGRTAARPAKTTSKKAIGERSAVRASISSPPPPHKRLSVVTFRDGAWWAPCLADVARASRVEVATYLFDDPELTQALLARLKKRHSVQFSCHIIVDAEAYARRASRHQRPRLWGLREPGAVVDVCEVPLRLAH